MPGAGFYSEGLALQFAVHEKTVDKSREITVYERMKSHSHRWIAAALLATCLASSVGCYPYTSDYYGPSAPNGGVASNGDAKGYSVPQEPAPPARPRYVGVDPGLVVAGVAAAGLVGYAIGNNHGYYHNYYGPGYYRPVPYGYYGPRFYGPRYCH
jgi:hypothetical protein